MSIETILESLIGNEKKDDILADVKQTIKDSVKENQTGIEEKHKKDLTKRNNENKNLRGRVKKIIEALDLDIDDEDELDEAIEEIQKKIKGKSSGGGDDKTAKELKKVLKELEKLKTKSVNDDKEKADLKLKNKKGDIRTDILKHLKKLKVLKPMEEDAADLIMNKMKIDEDGEVTLKINGKDFDVEDGVKNWIEPRKEFIENEQSQGGGSGNGGKGGSPKKEGTDLSPTDKMEQGFKKKD